MTEWSIIIYTTKQCVQLVSLEYTMLLYKLFQHPHGETTLDCCQIRRLQKDCSNSSIRSVSMFASKMFLATAILTTLGTNLVSAVPEPRTIELESRQRIQCLDTECSVSKLKCTKGWVCAPSCSRLPQVETPKIYFYTLSW